MTKTGSVATTYQSGQADLFQSTRMETATGIQGAATVKSQSVATETGTAERFRSPTVRPRPARVPVDERLLLRADDVLDDVEFSNAETMTLAMESLRYVTKELWQSVASATQYHQSLLAILESFVRSVEAVTPGQAAALRGAFKDLSNPLLSEQYLEVIRSRLIDEGHNPLAILSRMEDEGDDDQPAERLPG